MSKIFIADKPTLDVVNSKVDTNISSRASQSSLDTVSTNIGTANTNINAIKTKTNLMGVSNPTANTTTVMGYLRRVYDAVTSSGGGNTPVTKKTGIITIAQSSVTTIFNVTGKKGKIKSVLIKNVDATNRTCNLEIMVDGVKIVSLGTISTSPGTYYVVIPSGIEISYVNMSSVYGTGASLNRDTYLSHVGHSQSFFQPFEASFSNSASIKIATSSEHGISALVLYEEE